MSVEADELYQELILDHFRHPRCRGEVDCADAKVSIQNPLCGDTITLTVGVGPTGDAPTVRDVAFLGSGCSISQASASLMSELLRGKSIEEARVLLGLFRKMMKEELTPEEEARVGDAAALAGVRKFAGRVKCALLGWEALDRCLVQVGQRKAAQPSAEQTSSEPIKS